MFKFIAIALFSLFLCNNSFANTAVIDLQLIENNSLAMKDVMTKINKKKRSLQEEVSKQQQALNTEINELRGKETTFSPSVFQEKQKKLEAKHYDLQDDIKKKSDILNNATASSIEEISMKIRDIAEDIADKKSYTSVVPSANFIYFNPSEIHDISSEVLKILDKKLKSIDVDKHFDDKPSRKSKKKK